MSSGYLVTVDRDTQGPRSPDQHHQLSAAGDGSVQQIALQQYISVLELRPVQDSALRADLEKGLREVEVQALAKLKAPASLMCAHLHVAPSSHPPG